jgi:hypothetical protein
MAEVTDPSGVPWSARRRRRYDVSDFDASSLDYGLILICSLEGGGPSGSLRIGSACPSGRRFKDLLDAPARLTPAPHPLFVHHFAVALDDDPPTLQQSLPVPRPTAPSTTLVSGSGAHRSHVTRCA